MHIVSENSKVDIARERAEWQVDASLRNLAANILRVIRGAGRPWEIPEQAQSYINALVDYQAATGHLPLSASAENSLSIDLDQERLGDAEDEYRQKVEARETIIGGALRIAAARILDQRLQVTAGERELSDGLRYLDQAREALRKKQKAEQPPRPPRRPPARRKRQGGKS
jgi:hypothetical protein